MIAHHFSSGVYAKETHIPAGHVFVQHKHAHDHLSILAAGTVILTVDGSSRMVVGPACLNIEAGKHHGVKALTDAIWYCIWRTDETTAEDADANEIQPADDKQIAALLRA